MVEFDFNDFIRIKNTAPEVYLPGETGVVVGYFKIRFEELALKYNEPIGTAMFVIEFAAGFDKHIPGVFLELIEKDSKHGYSFKEE